MPPRWHREGKTSFSLESAFSELAAGQRAALEESWPGGTLCSDSPKRQLVLLSPVSAQKGAFSSCRFLRAAEFANFVVVAGQF